MLTNPKITTDHLVKKALVYVRPIVSTGRWIKKNSLKNRWLQLSPSCQLSPNLKTPPSASGKMGGKFVENLLVSI
jgi:hypothetical protein